MIINLNGEVNEEMFQTLTDGINQSIDKNEQILIYFTSNGGLLHISDAMIDVVNLFSDRVILVGYGSLDSAAFLFYFSVNCERKLLNGTTGMIHLPYFRTTLNLGNSAKDDVTKFNMKIGESEKNDFILKLKSLGLTKQELKKILDGTDLYFDYKRLLELNGKK